MKDNPDIRSAGWCRGLERDFEPQRRATPRNREKEVWSPGPRRPPPSGLPVSRTPGQCRGFYVVHEVHHRIFTELLGPIMKSRREGCESRSNGRRRILRTSSPENAGSVPMRLRHLKGGHCPPVTVFVDTVRFHLWMASRRGASQVLSVVGRIGAGSENTSQYCKGSLTRNTQRKEPLNEEI